MYVLDTLPERKGAMKQILKLLLDWDLKLEPRWYSSYWDTLEYLSPYLVPPSQGRQGDRFEKTQESHMKIICENVKSHVKIPRAFYKIKAETEFSEVSKYLFLFSFTFIFSLAQEWEHRSRLGKVILCYSQQDQIECARTLGPPRGQFCRGLIIIQHLCWVFSRALCCSYTAIIALPSK